MFRRSIALLFALMISGYFLPAVSAAPASGRIDLTDKIIRDENLVYIGADYLNPAAVLFDAQDYAPDSPENPKVSAETWAATDRSKNWKPNWQSEFGEDAFYIDLQANYVITGICYLDTNGVQDWVIEDGTPFAWQQIGKFTTDAYQTWQGYQIEKPRATRYLRFSTPCGDSGVSELAIYGYLASQLSDAQKAKTSAKPRPDSYHPEKLNAGGQIGFNAFIDDPMSAIMAAGNVREYHNLSWLLDENGAVKFTQGTWGDMDSYYSQMKKMGISIIPCIQGGSSVISGEKPPEIPVPAGADTLDPASYQIHAKTMYQIAARYGSNTKVDTKTLNVAEGSEPKIGMNLLCAVENCNEPNKTWSGKANYFSPYELAAMCSADYDGHEGTIPNAGVKQADPHFSLAVGGMLAGAPLLDYLSEMKEWFDYNRKDGLFAVDIINVHLGPDTFNPEDSGMAARIKEIRNWMNENAPNTQLWISEFEVPMSDCEKEGVDNHENEAYQLKYAQRVARTYLAAIGAGVDRITKFQLRDEGEGVYYDSGLVTQKGSWNKKLAWYYTACMTDVLREAYFAADMTEDEVKKYFFIRNRSEQNNVASQIYCLWLPTDSGKVIKDYKLQVPANAKVILTQPGTYAEGISTVLPVENGTVTLTVSETPVFVSISGRMIPVSATNGQMKYIRPVKMSLTQDFSSEICDLKTAPKNGDLNSFYQMFDESDTMPEFFYGDTSGLSAPKTSAGSKTLKCYVKLSEPFILQGCGVYDTYGTGDISIKDAYTGTVLWESTLGSYMARELSPTDEQYPGTDFLLIEHTGGDLNELALYGTPQPVHWRYDVNGDHYLDQNDIEALQMYLLQGKFPEQHCSASAADLNADGILNAADLSMLKKVFLS